MSSAPALARTVDALQLLVAQLSERVSFLEDRVAALERAESSWDAVSEARPSSVPGAFFSFPHTRDPNEDRTPQGGAALAQGSSLRIIAKDLGRLQRAAFEVSKGQVDSAAQVEASAARRLQMLSRQSAAYKSAQLLSQGSSPESVSRIHLP